MDYPLIPSAILLQVLLFISWSMLLYGAALSIASVLPRLVRWARFWQAWLAAAFVPLLPISFDQAETLIPEQLRRAFGDSANSLSNHVSAAVRQIDNQPDISLLLWGVCAVLCVGSGYGLLRFGLGLLKVQQFIKQAAPLRDFTGFDLAQRQEIKAKNIGVFTTNQAVSPLVFGFFRVQMLLPESVFSMPPQQRFLLIEHELTHIRRQDPKAVILFRLCASVLWFNPFIKYFEQRFLQSMELNCDMEVVAAFPQEKLHYAQALIASLKLSKNSLDSGLMTNFSGPRFQKQDFEDRIKATMSARLNKQYGMSYQLVLIFLFSLSVAFAVVAKPILPQYLFEPNDNDGKIPVANARVSSGYDVINSFRGPKPHQGIDLAAAKGTDVVASFSGKVLIADDVTLHRNYGKVVLIEHEGQVQSLYAHLDSFAVKSGQTIFAGQKLGTVGETGRATGPHLHFEILEQGKRADPNLYLNFTN